VDGRELISGLSFLSFDVDDGEVRYQKLNGKDSAQPHTSGCPFIWGNRLSQQQDDDFATLTTTPLSASFPLDRQAIPPDSPKTLAPRKLDLWTPSH
jgi:hypothetical protein